MKILIPLFVILLASCAVYSQHVISSDEDINRTLSVKDTFDLEFLHSCGYCWWSDRAYDTTLVSVRFISSRLIEGQLPKGGDQIHTIRFEGLKSGSVRIEFFWGRPWLKEKLHTCAVNVRVLPSGP